MGAIFEGLIVLIVSIVSAAAALIFGIAFAVFMLIAIPCRGRAYARATTYRLARSSRVSDSGDLESRIPALLRTLAYVPALAIARLFVIALDHARIVGPRGRRDVRRVAPSAVGLRAAAARLLPATDADRYAEEYFSELWELAESGAGRPRQMRYAVRQLVRALPIGFVLRSPRRRSAAP